MAKRVCGREVISVTEYNIDKIYTTHRNLRVCDRELAGTDPVVERVCGRELTGADVVVEPVCGRELMQLLSESVVESWQGRMQLSSVCDVTN